VTPDELEALTSRVFKAADPGLVGELRAAALGVEALLADSRARLHAVRGSAWLIAFKLGFRRGDLDAAIVDIGQAHTLEATGARALNLASALLERYELDGTAEDHGRALALLEASLDDPGASAQQRARRAVALLDARIQGVEHGLRGSDLDAVIDLGERLMGDPDKDAAGHGEVENLLRAAYELAAQRGHPRADLRRMVELLERAVDASPANHPDHPARLSNLGSAMLDRYEIAGDLADLDRAVVALETAYGELPESHPGRPLVLNNLLNVVVARYERTGAVGRVREVLPLALRLGDSFPAGHPLRPTALANAGLVARAASRALDAPGLIDQAVRLHRQACDETPQGSAALPGRQASLALALSDRYHRDRAPEDLHLAIELGEKSLGSTASHSIEIVGFQTNLANLYHDRYLLTGRMSDLVRAVNLHERGIAELPRDHHDRAALLNNAGITRAELYDRLGDATDLSAAAGHLSAAVTASDESDPEYAGRLINVGATLHRQTRLTGSQETLDAAMTVTERARATARRVGDRQIASGQLVDILRDQWRRTHDDRLLDQIQAVQDEAGPASTAAQQLSRAVTAGLMGDHDSEEKLLLGALEAGLDQRPAVAIVAAQLLSDHGLRLVAAEQSSGLGLVERAAAAAMSARDRIIELGEDRRAELSWHRELTGLGAMWAHARLLSGDLRGALDAFEQTRATLLRRYFAPSPPLSETFIAIWATPVGGAALVQAPGNRLLSVDLPDLTADTAQRLARRISASARLGRRSLTPVLASATRKLGESIVGPVNDAIKRGEPLTCCPGGPLALLPLHAADTADGPWLMAHPIPVTISQAAAEWAHQAARKSPDITDAVSIAAPAPTSLPALPAALTESAAFAPDRLRFDGTRATAQALLGALREHSVVHVATHAVTDAMDPLAQHFVLAHDQPLFADTVLDATPLSARLVVLAACGTGKTTVPHVDEGLTLASTLHAAGVPTVLASLWSVYDAATADLMTRVARRLHDGDSPTESLRNAQLAAIKAGRAASDWAPFATLGG
jgi:CHAT domain-containing protein/tetratricopeptide (TPR) repeat protein